MTNFASEDSSENSLHSLPIASSASAFIYLLCFCCCFSTTFSIANKPPLKITGCFTEQNEQIYNSNHQNTPSQPPSNFLGDIIFHHPGPWLPRLPWLHPRCIWSLESSVSTAKVDMPPTEPLRVAASCSEYKDVTRRFEEPSPRSIFPMSSCQPFEDVKVVAYLSIKIHNSAKNPEQLIIYSPSSSGCVLLLPFPFQPLSLPHQGPLRTSSGERASSSATSSSSSSSSDSGNVPVVPSGRMLLSRGVTHRGEPGGEQRVQKLPQLVGSF